MEYEYKVIDVADGAISSVLLGDGRIETAVLQAYINALAAEGWRMVFMEKVQQRYMLTSDRETLSRFGSIANDVGCGGEDLHALHARDRHGGVHAGKRDVAAEPA